MGAWTNHRTRQGAKSLLREERRQRDERIAEHRAGLDPAERARQDTEAEWMAFAIIVGLIVVFLLLAWIGSLTS